MEDAQIISVSTGTKCVNGEHMSVHGNSLNGKSVLYLSNWINIPWIYFLLS